MKMKGGGMLVVRGTLRDFVPGFACERSGWRVKGWDWDVIAERPA